MKHQCPTNDNCQYCHYYTFDTHIERSVEDIYNLPHNLDDFPEYYHFKDFPLTTNKYIEILIMHNYYLSYSIWQSMREETRELTDVVKPDMVNLGWPSEKWVTRSYLQQHL